MGKRNSKLEIDENLLKEFIEFNKSYWPKSEGEKYNWIGLFMVEKWMTWLQPKFLFAKALETKQNLNTLVLDWEYDEQLKDLYESYGFKFVAVKSEMKRNIAGAFLGLWAAFKICILHSSGKNLSDLKYKGRQIGQYIYDNCVRTKQGVYSIKNTRNKMCIKKIFTSIWFLNTLDKLAKIYPPQNYLFDDLVYDEGMVIQRMFDKNVNILKGGLYGAYFNIPWSDKPVYWTDIKRERLIKQIDELSEEEKENRINNASDDIEKRFKGLNGDTKEAEFIYKNKKSVDVEELKRIIGIDNGKKNVVIFAHCFSENAHKCSTQIYEDSYTWLEETLKIVSKLDNVNWIVKGHPVAAVKYNEVGVLEELFEKYKTNNLYWFPNEYDSSLASQLTDVVVTIYGTVGVEYACLGIPTLHTGSNTYSNMGYTYFAKTEKEYREYLEDIHNLPKLSEEQIRKAKLVFSLINSNFVKPSDEYDEKMSKLEGLFFDDIYNHDGFEEHNNLVTREILEYMKNNDIKSTEYYQRGLRL